MKPQFARYVFVGAVLAATIPSIAEASFHFMQIEQVIGGVNGDVTAQAVQLRMRAGGQHLLGQARLRAWDAAGANPVLLIDFVSNIPTAISNAGDRVLIVTSAFVGATTPPAIADYIMTNPIPASYLAAGSITFESDAGVILWRLSWGGASYTGSTIGDTTNDDDPGVGPADFGPPVAVALPSGRCLGLLFQGAATDLSTTNLAQYQVTPGKAIFTNFVDQNFEITTCVPTVTTWGLVAMTLAISAAGSVLVLRRRERSWPTA